MRDTSIIAYHDYVESGMLSKREYQVIQLLTELGASTANEIAELFHEKHRTVPSQSNIHARLNGLREKNVVDELPKRKCSKSGNLTIVWKLSGRHPIRPKKKLKCQHCGGTGVQNSDSDSQTSEKYEPQTQVSFF